MAMTGETVAPDGLAAEQVWEELRAALDAFSARSRREEIDVARIRGLMGHVDPWARGTPLHVTASALVVDPVSLRVLLRWHSRLRCWAQVGGHADPGERDPWRVALRESMEETGLGDLRGWPASAAARVPLQIVIVPVPAHGEEPAHEHADFRYLFMTSRPGRAVPESPATPLSWVSFPEAFERVAEADLREFLLRARQLLIRS
jgi:8-oxo-dGTP pyrophosphatase MutT (NUDIX family)